MRQALFPLSDICGKGMQTKPLGYYNTTEWLLLQNCRTNGVGIEAVPRYPSVVVPTDVVVEQIGLDVLLCGKTTIYSSDLTSLCSVAEGPRQWSCANFGLAAIFTNGLVNVLRTPEKTYEIVSDLPIANSMTNLLGQVIAGGLQSQSGLVVDPTMISWSQIGKLDFTIAKDNTAGYRQASVGTILSVKVLGGSCIVYGTDGIGELYPFGTTFGYKHVHTCTIEDETQIAGDEFQHYIRTYEGKLLSLVRASDIVRKQIDMKEIVDRNYLKEKPLKLSYNKQDKECLITYPTQTYCVNPSGLYTLGERVDAIHKGRCYVLSERMYVDIKTESPILNFNTPGFLTISEVFLGSNRTSAVSGIVKDQLGNTKSIPFNSANVIKPFLSGTQFTVGFQLPYDEDFTANVLSVNTIKTDNRFGRGVKL